jgi:hypothetical protein
MFDAVIFLITPISYSDPLLLAGHTIVEKLMKRIGAFARKRNEACIEETFLSKSFDKGFKRDSGNNLIDPKSYVEPGLR